MSLSSWLVRRKDLLHYYFRFCCHRFDFSLLRMRGMFSSSYIACQNPNRSGQMLDRWAVVFHHRFPNNSIYFVKKRILNNFRFFLLTSLESCAHSNVTFTACETSLYNPPRNTTINGTIQLTKWKRVSTQS